METRKTKIEVVLSVPPFTYEEIVAGDEAAVRARIAEIRAQGIEIVDGKYHTFKSPTNIDDIRYPVM